MPGRAFQPPAPLAGAGARRGGAARSASCAGTGWSPRRIADEVGRPHSTVHQVLRRGDCSRPEPAERPPIVRYEWPCPGNLLHMDVKRFGKFTEPGHKMTGDRTPLPARRLGVRALDRR